MTFKMPRGFSEIAQSHAPLHQYAIKDSATGFEARYFVRPYHLLDNSERPADDSASYKSFVNTLSNISLTKTVASLNIMDVDRAHARIDFNADYGLSASFKPAPQYAPSFANCISMFIRKNNIGEIYIFMLFNVFNRETEVIIGDVLGSVNYDNQLPIRTK
jgi:hypothetical protein